MRPYLLLPLPSHSQSHLRSCSNRGIAGNSSADRTPGADRNVFWSSARPSGKTSARYHAPNLSEARRGKWSEWSWCYFPCSQCKPGREKKSLETFDTGSTFLTEKAPVGGTYDKNGITVERDELVGDEDQIELALHMITGRKEEALLRLSCASPFQ